jgi:hypothetical protein
MKLWPSVALFSKIRCLKDIGFLYGPSRALSKNPMSQRHRIFIWPFSRSFQKSDVSKTSDFYMALLALFQKIRCLKDIGFLYGPFTIHNFRQKFRGAKLLPETQFTIHNSSGPLSRPFKKSEVSKTSDFERARLSILRARKYFGCSQMKLWPSSALFKNPMSQRHRIFIWPIHNSQFQAKVSRSETFA